MPVLLNCLIAFNIFPLMYQQARINCFTVMQITSLNINQHTFYPDCRYTSSNALPFVYFVPKNREFDCPVKILNSVNSSDLPGRAKLTIKFISILNAVIRWQNRLPDLPLLRFKTHIKLFIMHLCV